MKTCMHELVFVCSHVSALERTAEGRGRKKEKKKEGGSGRESLCECVCM